MATCCFLLMLANLNINSSQPVHWKHWRVLDLIATTRTFSFLIELCEMFDSRLATSNLRVEHEADGSFWIGDFRNHQTPWGQRHIPSRSVAPARNTKIKLNPFSPERFGYLSKGETACDLRGKVSIAEKEFAMHQGWNCKLVVYWAESMYL